MPLTMQEAEARLKPGRMLIGGEWIASSTGGEFVHRNPITGAEHPPILMGGTAEVEQAVAAARAALPGWKAMPVNQRRDLMLRLAALIREAGDDLAAFTSIDNGSLHMFGQISVQSAAEYFTYFAGWVDKLGGDVIPTWPAPALDYARLEPYGVVGVIIPWNVPLHNIGQVVGSALAAGNCIVFKPPELAPFTTLRFAELVVEAGFPAGVLNVVPGGPDCGAAMVESRGIDKLHFIGSGATAQKITEASAKTLKPLTLELGGKSATILFEDADPEIAVRTAVGYGFGNSGQACNCGSRVLVHDSIYDRIVPAIVGAAQALKVGDPFEADTRMGPIITEGARQRILGMIERTQDEACGTLLTGGKPLDRPGYFLEATVFGDVANESYIARNEVFGPVMSIIRFSDEEEAVRIANDSEFGLAAYFCTNDLKRAHRVAGLLEAGNIGINGGGIQTGAPFGGVKQSGYGRMGGKYGVLDFMKLKNVYIPLD